ncbi:MAG TPA: hypothetical protein VIA62_21305 [Thermoanaerobaculia bacterium]|jgi:hypothetical protein|nr:hypothetical protein [Thermoanaerobaculia bacterium]
MYKQERESRRNLTLLRTALLAVVATLLASGALVAQSHGDQFTAVLANMAGGGTAPVVIHIDHYSSDAQIANLKAILANKGPDALRDALWDLEAGYIRIGGGLGYPIAVATSRPEANGGGRVVRLMMDRPISFREQVTDALSRDYPFSYVEIHLDASGKGEGKFIAAAKVSITAGTVDIESFGVQPIRLLQVKAR